MAITNFDGAAKRDLRKISSFPCTSKKNKEVQSGKINKGGALIQAAKVSSKAMRNGVCSARYEDIKGSVATAQARRIPQTEFKPSAPRDKQIEINK